MTLFLLAAFAAAPPPVTVVAFGDSTTAPRKGVVVYADLLAERLPKQGVPVTVVNSGFGGYTTEMAGDKLKAAVLDKKPDVVVIQFGINDAAVDVWKTPPADKPRVGKDKYEANLTAFVKAARAAGARPVLMTPNPLRWSPAMRKLYAKPPYQPDDPDGLTAFVAGYAEVVRKVGKDLKVPVVDVYQGFAAKGGKATDALLLDGVHPNSDGHALVADLLVPVVTEQAAAARKK
jgi:lysophospholipase L1-like esterase